MERARIFDAADLTGGTDRLKYSESFTGPRGLNDDDWALRRSRYSHPGGLVAGDRGAVFANPAQHHISHGPLSQLPFSQFLQLQSWAQQAGHGFDATLLQELGFSPVRF